MAKRTRVAKRAVARLHPGVKGPQLVQFYDEGLRAGWLMGTEGNIGIVQPIGALYVVKPRRKRILLNELIFPSPCAATSERKGAS